MDIVNKNRAKERLQEIVSKLDEREAELLLRIAERWVHEKTGK